MTTEKRNKIKWPKLKEVEDNALYTNDKDAVTWASTALLIYMWNSTEDKGLKGTLEDLTVLYNDFNFVEKAYDNYIITTFVELFNGGYDFHIYIDCLIKWRKKLKEDIKEEIYCAGVIEKDNFYISGPEETTAHDSFIQHSRDSFVNKMAKKYKEEENN